MKSSFYEEIKERNRLGKYRKKPVIIDAVQFRITREIPCKHGIHYEYNEDEIANFTENIVRTGWEPNGTPEGELFFEIPTLEGTMRASLNDWIIKGVNGEFYPCKPDIFEKSYEEVKSL